MVLETGVPNTVEQPCEPTTPMRLRPEFCIARKSPAAAPVGLPRKRLRTKSRVVPDSAALTTPKSDINLGDALDERLRPEFCIARKSPAAAPVGLPRRRLRKKSKVVPDRLKEAAASARSRKRPTRTTQGQGSLADRRKRRKSSSSSTWRSEDADSGSGFFEEFYNSDSD